MAGFNWVKARSECSLQRIFQTLAEVVDSDVKSANDLGRPNVSFHIDTQATGKIMVTRDRNMGAKNEVKSVVFALAQFSITVTTKRLSGDPQSVLSVVPNMDENGECLLTIQDKAKLQPMKLWQVSRYFLEDLFFNF
jgi:hypothetical protein